MTLQLRDLDGVVVGVPLEPRRRLTIAVELTGDAATDLRRVVRADVVRRAADRHRALAHVVSLSDPTEDLAALIVSVNCRPLSASSAHPDVTVGPAPAAVVRTLPADDGASLPPLDGLELRHALLARGTGDPAEVEGWQRLVARWAESPSKPMCADYVERCHAAADADVDTAALLAVMRELAEDETLPPGCRFETFAHLDALVGLDLSARVGQPVD